MSAIDRHRRAAAGAASQADRPLARSDVAAAGRARPSRAQAAAGDPCRRHQRQGLDHRVHARDPGSGGPARACLYLAASGALQRALPRSARPGEGALVADDELAAALEECERANAGAPITVFEITTAAGLLLFSRHPADVLLLEVGLGGRLDATNVIDEPLATRRSRRCRSIMPTISATPSRRSRPRRPASSSATCRRSSRAQPREALGGDRARGGARRARRSGLRARTGPRPRSAAGWSIRTTTGCSTCRRRSCRGAISSRTPASRSRRCARCRRCSLPPPAFEAGSRRPNGRRACSGCRTASCRRCCRPGSELWLDGGHNADGGRAVAAALADLEERVSRPLVLVVGMLATKDARASCGISPGSRGGCIAVPIPDQEKSHAGRRRSPTSRAASAFRRRRATTSRARSRAVGRLGLDPPPRVLITGSLYLAGEVLKRERHAAGIDWRRKLAPKTKWPASRPAVRNQSDASAAQTAAVIHCSSFCFGAAPTWREAMLAVLEDHQRRDRHDAVLRRGLPDSRRR